jgi:hypothetical protein
MRALRFVFILSFAVLMFGGSAVAQEGHPLKGSWLGVWGLSEDHVNDVIVILDWDGERITGIINPGTDNVEIENATLDPNGWVLRFEAEMQDQTGATFNNEVEGHIENLAFPDRSIVGTWTNQRASGPFEVTRQ